LQLLPRAKPTTPLTPPRSSYITTPNWRSPRRMKRVGTTRRVKPPSPMRGRLVRRTARRTVRRTAHHR
jgi:hypothetical protein